MIFLLVSKTTETFKTFYVIIMIHLFEFAMQNVFQCYFVYYTFFLMNLFLHIFLHTIEHKTLCFTVHKVFSNKLVGKKNTL